MIKEFIKAHGLGNDFLIAVSDDLTLNKLDIVRILDRNRGFGGDGLILFRPDETYDFEMKLFNQDGGEAEISGNGLRCLAHVINYKNLTPKMSFTVHTKVGPRFLEIISVNNNKALIFEEMGEVSCKESLMDLEGVFSNSVIAALEVSVGNPHLVVFFDSIDGIDLEYAGKKVQALYKDGINLEVATFHESDILMKVFERGVGLTQSCGSGSVAIAKAAQYYFQTGLPVKVVNPGGTLTVEERESIFYMTGESEIIGSVAPIELRPA